MVASNSLTLAFTFRLPRRNSMVPPVDRLLKTSPGLTGGREIEPTTGIAFANNARGKTLSPLDFLNQSTVPARSLSVGAESSTTVPSITPFPLYRLTKSGKVRVLLSFVDCDAFVPSGSCPVHFTVPFASIDAVANPSPFGVAPALDRKRV